MLTEAAPGERTGLWAWKHPHQREGTVTYQELTGDVVFDDVDFGLKFLLKDKKLASFPTVNPPMPFSARMPPTIAQHT